MPNRETRREADSFNFEFCLIMPMHDIHVGHFYFGVDFYLRADPPNREY